MIWSALLGLKDPNSWYLLHVNVSGQDISSSAQTLRSPKCDFLCLFLCLESQSLLFYCVIVTFLFPQKVESASNMSHAKGVEKELRYHLVSPAPKKDTLTYFRQNAGPKQGALNPFVSKRKRAQGPEKGQLVTGNFRVTKAQGRHLKPKNLSRQPAKVIPSLRDSLGFKGLV